MAAQNNDELFRELQQLRKENISLKAAYEKEITGLNNAIIRSEKSEQKYRQLFLESPVSIWEEDFSEVKTEIDAIKKNNISDLHKWFLERPDLVKELARKVKIVDINKATLKLYKAKSKASFFDNITTIFSTESYESFIDALVVIAKGETELYTQKTHLALDGSTLNIQLYWYVAAGHEHDYARVMVSIVDITETVNIARALDEKEEVYRLLFETANDAILIMDNDVFIECNSKAEKVYGCSKEHIIGSTPLDFSPEFQPCGGDSAPLAMDKIKATLTGDSQLFEWQHKRTDGSLFDTEISLSAFTVSNKTFTQAIVRDVTERKEAEKTKQVLFQIANEILHNFKLDDFIKAVEQQHDGAV